MVGAAISMGFANIHKHTHRVACVCKQNDVQILFFHAQMESTAHSAEGLLPNSVWPTRLNNPVSLLIC